MAREDGNAAKSDLNAGDELVRFHMNAETARITLDRPRRGNSLVRELIADFRHALAGARAAKPRVLVIGAVGKAFSSGGDIAGFLDHADDPAALRAYAHDLVGGLNAAIMELMAFPAPVLAAVQGPVTGGSLGFLLASDIVVMSANAFVQPYYVEVGFAPDGGWSVMLPRRIGEARALEIQMLNRRIDAWRAHAFGLATSIAAAEEFDASIAQHVDLLLEKDDGGLMAARRLVRSPARREEIAQGLEAERALFVERIALPQVIERMRRFSAR